MPKKTNKRKKTNKSSNTNNVRIVRYRMSGTGGLYMVANQVEHINDTTIKSTVGSGDIKCIITSEYDNEAINFVEAVINGDGDKKCIVHNISFNNKADSLTLKNLMVVKETFVGNSSLVEFIGKTEAVTIKEHVKLMGITEEEGFVA